MKRSFFALSLILIAGCTAAGAYFEFIQPHLISRTVSRFVHEGQLMEQTNEIYSDGAAAASVSNLGPVDEAEEE